jgi:DNA-binding NarL/FixJ family response regulator
VQTRQRPQIQNEPSDTMTLRALRSARVIAVRRSSVAPRQRSGFMSYAPKLASLMAATELPGPKDPENPIFPVTLLLRRDTRDHPAPSGMHLSDSLTTRERDVLAMISHGFSNKHIARALEISPETVKSHVKRLFLKLAASTRAEAAFRAGSLGLL